MDAAWALSWSTLNAIQKHTYLHNARLWLKYYSNVCIHSNLHLSEFPSFILKVIESLDKNIYLYLLNHFLSLVIIVNTEAWTFHSLTIILNSDVILLHSRNLIGWKLKIFFLCQIITRIYSELHLRPYIFSTCFWLLLILFEDISL